MPTLNPLLLAADAPPIPEARAWTRRYAGAHGPLVDLSQAAPGAPPPEGLLARLGIAASDPEAARYGDIAGEPALREAYARHLSAVYGGRIGPGEVAVTAGCNQAYFVAAMLAARAGEALMLPVPWYFNYKTTLDILGVDAVPLPCAASSGFVPDAAAAERLLTDRVRAIVLISPNNPTGAVYPPAVIAGFLALCRARGIRLILDETYADFLPEAGSRAHELFRDGSWRGTLIRLSSFSKGYAIPGHRVGTIVADAEAIGAVEKVQDNLQICAPRAAQIALAWAIDALAEWREMNRAEINARGEAFARALAAAPGWRVESRGAYFAYVRHPLAGARAAAVAERLAAERGVLTLPGSYFGPGQDGHLRIAIANVERATIDTLAARFAGLAAGDAGR